MNDKEHICQGAVRFVICCLLVLAFLAGIERAMAQQVTTLIEFTNVWKYDQSGLDLGTAWRTNDYDDSAWPSGAGLLGDEPGTPQVYQIHAPISTPLTVSSTVTTYYFRTTFHFAGSTNGLSLFATNLVDDGCVIYLNGVESGRLRVVNPQNARTLASIGTEGALELMSLANLTHLRQGENLLAVEVHQASPGGDVMWGMKLIAFESTPLIITADPTNRIATMGEEVTLSVGVSGGPVSYRWQKDGINIANATNASYTISSAQPASAGEYRAMVSNAVNVVTSNPALLSVFADATGPRPLSAVVRETGQTNQILLTFSEFVQSGFVANSTSTNRANYRVTRCGTAEDVIVSNVAQNGNQVLLRVGGPNWAIGDCYYVTVNNVTDTWTNRIAPDSRVPLEWPVQLNLLGGNESWSFHASAWFDPGIYAEDWTATNYVEGPWWAQGSGVFYGGPPPAASCFGLLQTPAGFQPEPMLFRTTFEWPAHLGSTAHLRPSWVVDDGLVLYLNGTEILRTNMAAASGPVSALTRATTDITLQLCRTNAIVVTNLMSGQNWLAAAATQSSATGNGDLLFGLALTAFTTTNAPLQDMPVPSLHMNAGGTKAVRLWWTGGGYALESTTNLTDNSASYPYGPWQEVPVMSNPYTNSLSSPARFFRLKR